MSITTGAFLNYRGMPHNTMKNETPYIFKVKIPSHVDYIPPIRKFIAEVLQIKGFDSKFSFRSEVIVDEICYNAVMYGPNRWTRR